MAKNTQETFKDAEAQGHMKSLPELPEHVIDFKTPEAVADDPETFRLAIGRAQMDGLDYVEVTDKLFQYLVKNQKTNYLTYGSPGIKVFRHGTREELLQEETLKAEDYAVLEHQKRQSGRL